MSTGFGYCRNIFKLDTNLLTKVLKIVNFVNLSQYYDVVY